MKLLAPILVAGIMLATGPKSPDPQQGSVGFVRIKGAIGPATANYISRAIHVAERRHDACLIFQLDTPGGLVSSTHDIVDAFHASSVPIVVYVAPFGAGATSAGTFITMAADVAAMAPNTRIGAAHPVTLGFSGGGGGGTNDFMAAKAENELATYARNIAEEKKRNAVWAESAVRQSVSITSEEALQLDVIDLIAKDMPDLLRQLDTREINGRPLKTAGASIAEIPMSWGEKALSLLRPEMMFILMLIAIYGIIGELSNPGAILPGVVGAIALILFLYMGTVLPVSVAGIALILLAVLLFVIDIFAPTHGVLTVGGIVAFLLGALMLFNPAGPAFRLSLGWIVPATVVTALFFLFVVAAGLRAQRLPVQVGNETLIGRTVSAETRIDATAGKVFVEGEIWNAVSEPPVEAGQPVEIVGITGLTLKVKPKT